MFDTYNIHLHVDVDLLNQILAKEDLIMGGLDEQIEQLKQVKAQIETEKQEVLAAVDQKTSELNAKIDELKTQLENAQGVSQEDKDALNAVITDISNGINSISDVVAVTPTDDKGNPVQ